MLMSIAFDRGVGDFDRKALNKQKDNELMMR